jgi:3'-5' exoribonuclease 1
MQAQVDAAPTFPDVMRNFEQWLMKHKLLTKKSKHLRPNVVFATDGPWDLCNFVTKSLHLSRCPKPLWLPQTYIDIRELVSTWYVKHHATKVSENGPPNQVSHSGLAE